MKKSLKQIVYRLMDKQGFALDQQIVREYGELPNFQTVETYKTAWKKEQWLKVHPNS